MSDIYTILAENKIPYTRYDHPAVFTVEESEKICENIPGAKTKNLFLRNRAGDKHYLVVIAAEKRADLKKLESLLDEKKLSFASPERLQKYLGLTPGSVTFLGLVNDVNHEVKIIFDEDVINAEAIQTHPLTNTATLTIAQEGVRNFLQLYGNGAQFLKL